MTSKATTCKNTKVDVPELCLRRPRHPIGSAPCRQTGYRDASGREEEDGRDDMGVYANEVQAGPMIHAIAGAKAHEPGWTGQMTFLRHHHQASARGAGRTIKYPMSNHQKLPALPSRRYRRMSVGEIEGFGIEGRSAILGDPANRKPR